MIMHSPKAKIRYAEFRDLGRSDRRIPISDTNVIGRYPLHFHRTGAKDLTKMAIAEGNSVINGVGWGIVHHDSVAAVNHNFVFNIVGAGIVSEAGNEVGEWVGNLVTSVTGSGFSMQEIDRKSFGPGHAGVAYFSSSRAVIQQRNIAANTKMGWDFEGRLGEVTGDLVGSHGVSPRMFKFNPNPFREHFSDRDMNQLIGFEGNRAFALDDLIHSTHRTHGEQTNTVNEIRDFKAWRIHGTGFNFKNYTWDYVFRDCILVAAPNNNESGSAHWKKSEGMSYVNVHIENYPVGISYDLLNFGGKLHNVTFKNVKTPIQSMTDYMYEKGETYPHPETGKPYVPQAIPLDIVNGPVQPLAKPSLKLDPSNNYIIKPGSTVSIKGVVTDSFGNYNLGESIWWTSPHRYSEPKVRFTSWGHKLKPSDRRGIGDLVDILPYHGVIKKDGKWQMPVTFWIADRFTGFNHPFTVYFEVQNLDENFLAEHEIHNYQEPTKDLNLYDETSEYN